MTRGELLADLAALERHLDGRVELRRVVIDASGNVIKRIRRGSFGMPPDWTPPTLEQLIQAGRKNHD